tara:strand:+ start:199 stop:636 length:438 start_codon:yes stop_codon:yes gene_type:complete
MPHNKKYKPCPVEFTSSNQKHYYLNRKKCLDRQLQYAKDNPEKRKRSIRVDNWKRKGVIDEDLWAIHEVYDKETNCWICGKKFLHTMDRCLDHCHKTGEPRYICCNKCNTTILSEKYHFPDVKYLENFFGIAKYIHSHSKNFCNT